MGFAHPVLTWVQPASVPAREQVSSGWPLGQSQLGCELHVSFTCSEAKNFSGLMRDGDVRHKSDEINSWSPISGDGEAF